MFRMYLAFTDSQQLRASSRPVCRTFVHANQSNGLTNFAQVFRRSSLDNCSPADAQNTVDSSRLPLVL